MASSNDYPVETVRDLLYRLNDRVKRSGGQEVYEADIMITIEEARAFYAAMRYLEIMEIQGVGYEATPISLRECMVFLKEKGEEMRYQGGDEKILHLDHFGLRAMRYVERHLDHFAIIKEGDAASKKRGKRKS